MKRRAFFATYPPVNVARIHSLRRSSLRALWLCLVAFTMVMSRVSYLALPWMAMFAPAVCTICHGCPVDEDHDVCDCEACQEQASGVGVGLWMSKNQPHGGPSKVASHDDARFVVPQQILVLRYEILLAELSADVQPLVSRPAPRPLLPPPRLNALV